MVGTIFRVMTMVEEFVKNYRNVIEKSILWCLKCFKFKKKTSVHRDFCRVTE